jgi:broad specificity phosphatase PhoE
VRFRDSAIRRFGDHQAMPEECDLFVLRHGRSLANEASLIVSSVENGVLPQYALAPTGKEQAAAAGRLLAATLLGDDADADATTAPEPTEIVVHFYASPFSRTVETAAIAAEAFEKEIRTTTTAAAARIRLAGLPQIEPALRERFFGAALELQNHEGYSPAWASDAQDPTSRPPGKGDGESVADVAARSAELLRRLAEEERDAETTATAATRQVIVLVSHGDTLSILQTAATGGDLREHRKFGLGTAELKRVGGLREAARHAARVAAEATAAMAAAR